MTDTDSTPRSPALAGPVLIAAALSSVLLAACDIAPPRVAAPAPTATPSPLVPAIRLVGTEFQTGGGRAVVRGSHVTIDGVIRPTFTGSQQYFFHPDCTPAEDDPDTLDCAIELPPDMATTPWVVIETTLPPTEEPASEPADPRAAAVTPTLRMMAPGLLSGGVEPQHVRLPEEATSFFFARAMPELPARTVATPEMVLPGGGVLRTYIGIEEAAQGPRAIPIVFTVSVLPKGGTKLERIHRTILDPARRKRHRSWVPLEIPLADRGAEPFRLVFESLPRDKGDLRPSLPVWGDPTILRPEGKRRHPRHIVLISLDTLRARSMSAYGYHTPTTPKFEKLLSEGTLFEKAFTTFSNTLGAHMSMLTGLYPANHRVRAMNLTLDEAIPTLAARVRDAGYETAAFTEDALLRAEAGFQRGFARYFENKDIADGAGDAEGTFRRALAWTGEQPDEPLFLFVHTYEVHAPYRPPDYTEKELAGIPSPGGPVPHKLRRYEREILHLDRLLADFLARLEELAPPGDLLVIIAADHGEEFLEHGSLFHVQLFDEVMHVPLFMRWPGRIPEGLRIDTPVSLVDVVPTVLDLVGAEPVRADGTSLVPLIEGASLARDAVFAQTARSAQHGGKIHYIARSATAKCIVRGDEEADRAECFDLVADPEEKNPLGPETSPELTALHAEALAYRAQAKRVIEGEAEEKELTAEDEADPRRREKLRMLGYVE